MHPTPVSLRTKNATFGGDITRFLKGVGPEIHIGGEGGREGGREGGASALNTVSSLPYQLKLRFQCLFTNQSFCWTWTRFMPFLKAVA